MIRMVLRWCRSIYVLLFFVTVILSLAIWFFAPFIGSEEWHPFDSIRSRIITIVCVSVFFLLIMLLIFFLRRRKNRKMTEEIAEAAEPVEEDAVSEEIGELRGKFKLAMTELRKSKNGKRHLNELPWYVMIGPPGAGKTTAIVNSGLQFPLADKLGKAAIGGVGGTRNCDWWFTNEAVLIDTAGLIRQQHFGKVGDLVLGAQIALLIAEAAPSSGAG